MSIRDFSQRYGAFMGGFKRADVSVGSMWLRWAMHVHADCHELKPVGLFGKPGALPSFLKIRQAQDKLRGGSVSKKARALMSEYNVWLVTVLDAECENTGRMDSLLTAYCVFRDEAALCLQQAQRAGVAAEEANTLRSRAVQHEAAQHELKRHIVRAWLEDRKVWHEPENNRDKVDALAAWYCRRTDVLPTWLLNGNPVPDSAYEAESMFAGDLKDDFDDDEETPQRRRRSGNDTEPEQLTFTVPDFSPGSSHD